MTDVSLVYALGDDWSGLYVDGALLMEGHDVRATEVFEWLKDFGEIRVVEYQFKEVNCGWLSDHGSLPPLLTDVVWYDDDYEPKPLDDELGEEF